MAIVDGSHVYWAGVSGTIFAVDKDGGSANPIATLAAHPADLAVDCGALYVAIAQDAPDGGLPGGIFKVAKLP
jgi:hypothetical protein